VIGGNTENSEGGEGGAGATGDGGLEFKAGMAFLIPEGLAADVCDEENMTGLCGDGRLGSGGGEGGSGETISRTDGGGIPSGEIFAEEPEEAGLEGAGVAGVLPGGEFQVDEDGDFPVVAGDGIFG